MKKMKRFLSLLVAVIMLLAFTACGGGNGGASDTGAAEETASAADGNSEAAELTTVTEGVLTMATNAEFPPYEFYEGGEVVGIDAEIAGAIAEKLGLELVIDDMDFNAIVAAVTSGKADMGMAGMTVTEERLQSVDFSTSYATGVQVVIVAEDSEITSIDDLFVDGADYYVGVQESTTGDIYATGDIEDAGFGTINRYKKGADAVQALITGKIDCVIIDNEPAKAFVEANDGIKILDTEYVEEDYAISFSKDSSALRDAVDNALQELIADGTVQSIIDKYISAD